MAYLNYLNHVVVGIHGKHKKTLNIMCWADPGAFELPFSSWLFLFVLVIDCLEHLAIFAGDGILLIVGKSRDDRLSTQVQCCCIAAQVFNHARSICLPDLIFLFLCQSDITEWWTTYSGPWTGIRNELWHGMSRSQVGHGSYDDKDDDAQRNRTILGNPFHYFLPRFQSHSGNLKNEENE